MINQRKLTFSKTYRLWTPFLTKCSECDLGPEHDTNGQQRRPQDVAQPTNGKKFYNCRKTTTTVNKKAHRKSHVPPKFTDPPPSIGPTVKWTDISTAIKTIKVIRRREKGQPRHVDCGTLTMTLLKIPPGVATWRQCHQCHRPTNTSCIPWRTSHILWRCAPVILHNSGLVLSESTSSFYLNK